MRTGRPPCRRRWARAVLPLLVFALGGCSVAVPRFETSVPSCRDASPSDRQIRWIVPADPRQARQSQPWCEPVGPAVFSSAPPDVVASFPGALLIVSWNVEVGGGDVEELLRRLVDEERRGGRPRPGFVLLLQEAYRTGLAVPASYGAVARVPNRIAQGARDWRDIETLAIRLGMNFAYVPSMRNGRSTPEHPDEDRGNAILSTLPLHDVAAIELPFERQRRVAVAARVDFGGSSLTVVSVHLETRRPFSRGSVFSGPFARQRQAAALAAALAVHTAGPVVVGGDFNTVAGPREPAIREMERRLARVSCRSSMTHQWGWSLDYLFASDASMFQECVRHRKRFDSDHYPLVARVARGRGL